MTQIRSMPTSMSPRFSRSSQEWRVVHVSRDSCGASYLGRDATCLFPKSQTQLTLHGHICKIIRYSICQRQRPRLYMHMRQSWRLAIPAQPLAAPSCTSCCSRQCLMPYGVRMRSTWGIQHPPPPHPLPAPRWPASIAREPPGRRGCSLASLEGERCAVAPA